MSAFYCRAKLYFEVVNHLEWMRDELITRGNAILQKSLIHVTSLSAGYVLKISANPKKMVEKTYEILLSVVRHPLKPTQCEGNSIVSYLSATLLGKEKIWKVVVSVIVKYFIGI